MITMGLMDNFRSAQRNQVREDWHILTSVDQLDTLIEASHNKPVAIFKHSTTCGISALAKYELERGWNLKPQELDLYYLDLLAYRPVSNAVAERLGVRHQSPQLIILQDGQAAFDTSHHGVHFGALRRFLDDLQNTPEHA